MEPLPWLLVFAYREYASVSFQKPDLDSVIFVVLYVNSVSKYDISCVTVCVHLSLYFILLEDDNSAW